MNWPWIGRVWSHARIGGTRLSQEAFKMDRSTLIVVKRHLKRMGDGERPSPADLAVWRRFYNHCNPIIQRFVRIYVRTRSDIDDCTQEVWMRLIKHLRTFDYQPSRGAFSSWLYKVVRSVTASYFRHEYRISDGERQSLRSVVTRDAASDPTKLVEQTESHRRVKDLLILIRRNVSRPNYELLYMRWVQQRSVQDVADALKISCRQVWYREYRARKKLRSVVSKHRE